MITNSSFVPAHFRMERDEVESSLDGTGFSISPKKGTIPPGEMMQVNVTYRPKIANCQESAKYRLWCDSGNKLTLHAQGNAVGFDVNLSAKSINFGEVSIGKRNTRLLNIENHSPLPTKFQFYVDSNNMFSFDRTCGVVPANSSERIIINFAPSRTQIYYERAYCIIKNHSVLYVDLMGTCSDILTKPMPIM